LKERGNFARKVKTVAIYLQKIYLTIFEKVFPTVYRWSPSWNMGYSLPYPPLPPLLKEEEMVSTWAILW